MWLKVASGSYLLKRKIPTSVEGYKALLRSPRFNGQSGTTGELRQLGLSFASRHIADASPRTDAISHIDEAPGLKPGIAPAQPTKSVYCAPFKLASGLG